MMNPNAFQQPDESASAERSVVAEDLLRWNDETMRTGIATIDEQHQELIAKINELYRIHLAGATVDDIKVMLKFLDGFMQKHFKHEEGLFEKFNCPQHRTNCTAHAWFLVEYQSLVSNFTMDPDPDDAATKIERLAARWLSTHICQVDIALREGPKG